jgi:CRP-like cAMP-binding protein
MAKALGHRHRLAILEFLAEEEATVAVVARRARLSLANASHHLRLMRNAGLLASRRDGKYILYCIRDPSVLQFAATLKYISDNENPETGHKASRSKADVPAGRSSIPRPSSASPAAPPGRLDWLGAAGVVRVRQLVAGESLFRQEDLANAIYQVASGRIRLIRHTSDNRLITMHTAKAGELFAEASLFSPTYHCDAVAAVPSTVWAYPKARLLTAFRGDPALPLRFMTVLARQIQELRARLEERNIRSARERVLHHLALAMSGNDRSIILDGTLMDLAREIGLTHESLYRTLAALEKEGAIRRRGREISLNKSKPI